MIFLKVSICSLTPRIALQMGLKSSPSKSGPQKILSVFNVTVLLANDQRERRALQQQRKVNDTLYRLCKSVLLEAPTLPSWRAARHFSRSRCKGETIILSLRAEAAHSLNIVRHQESSSTWRANRFHRLKSTKRPKISKLSIRTDSNFRVKN